MAATTVQRESTQFTYFGITGTVPDTAEVAYLEAATRPTEDDWDTATLATSAASPLWLDAKASGAKGDYYVALLVGAFGDNPVVLDPADYVAWVRLTGSTEQQVIIAPVTLTVA